MTRLRVFVAIFLLPAAAGAADLLDFNTATAEQLKALISGGLPYLGAYETQERKKFASDG